MSYYKPRKDQKKVVIDGKTFTVDKGMVSLIKALNGTGFKTVMHCKGGGGKYHSDFKYVMFHPDVVEVGMMGSGARKSPYIKIKEHHGRS